MTGITKEEAVKMFARCAEVADTDEDIVAIFTNAILERAAVESERTARMHAAQQDVKSRMKSHIASAP